MVTGNKILQTEMSINVGIFVFLVSFFEPSSCRRVNFALAFQTVGRWELQKGQDGIRRRS